MSTESAVQVDRHAQAAEIISSAAAWSAAAGAVPLPLLDLVAVGTVQGKMVADLARLYGEQPSKELARGVVSVMLGTLFPAGLTNALIGSTTKFLPISALFGMASMAALSAAATYAIGKVFVRHFEKGGDLASFSPHAVKEELQREFAQAKSKQTDGAPA